jgi:phage repressor protein C with HTH and peptisase S24 domain
MVPTLAPGERLLVRYGASFGEGDIVLVQRADRVEVKRVVQVSTDGVHLAGDNAAVSTDSRHYGPVSTSAVIARVVRALPYWLRAR